MGLAVRPKSRARRRNALDDADVAVLVSGVASASDIRNTQPRKPRRAPRWVVGLVLVVAILATVVGGWKALRAYMGPGGNLDWLADRQTERYANAGYDDYRDSHGRELTALSVGPGTKFDLTLADTLCARVVDLVYLRRRVAPLEARSCADAGVAFVELPVAQRVRAIVAHDSLRRAGVREYVRTNVEHAAEIARAAGVGPLGPAAMAETRAKLERLLDRLDDAQGGRPDPPPYLAKLSVASEQGVQISFHGLDDGPDPAVLSFYAPHGTRLPPSQPGDRLGQVFAEVLDDGNLVEARGAVVAARPRASSGGACAPGIVDTLWTLVVTLPSELGGRLRIPLFVDATGGGPDASLGSLRLRACVPSTQSEGAPRIVTLTMQLRKGVLVPPARSHRWVARFVPYESDGEDVDRASEVEARALVRLPQRVVLNVRPISEAFARATVTAVEDGMPVAGAALSITANGETLIARGTPPGGTLGVTVPGGAVTLTAEADVFDRDVTATACRGSARPCVSAVVSAWKATSRPVTLAG